MTMKMTVPKLEELILEGRGVGVGDKYLPWIQLTKRGTSTSSNQSSVPMPGLSRLCHFLSRAERHMAHVLWWVGVDDVREQFPLWPWPHAHPLKEIDPVEKWPRHPGMTEVAREAGVRLYNYPGIRVPTILSIDLLVTLPSADEEASRMVGVSCKPASVFTQAEACDRKRERLELDRLYCKAGNLRHLLIHPEQLPATLTRQLDWLAPLHTRAFTSGVIASHAYQTFLERLSKHVYAIPADAAAREASRGLHWTTDFSQFVMRMAMWRLDIDVDLLQPISMTSPLKPGGRALRTVLRSRLFGDMAWK